MSWVKIEPRIFTHPKFRKVKGQAKLLYFAGLCYANAFTTDGYLGDEDLAIVGIYANARSDDERQELVDQLVTAGLWEPEPEPGEQAGYWIHDYADYQPTRDELAWQRAANARRKALLRDQALKGAIRDRDVDCCRYCGQAVAWRDRRSPAAATYDPVDPCGGNHFQNLVVACRGCSTSKGNRTPSEAGMALLPPPNPDAPPPATGPSSEPRSDLGDRGLTPRLPSHALNGRTPARTPRADPVDIASLREARSV